MISDHTDRAKETVSRFLAEVVREVSLPRGELR